MAVMVQEKGCGGSGPRGLVSGRRLFDSKNEMSNEEGK